MNTSSRLCLVSLVAGLALVPSVVSAQVSSEPITLGHTVSTTLAVSDPIYAERGTHYRGYSFSGAAGDRVELRVASESMDTYLILLGPDGLELARDDDSAGNLDARVVVSLPSAGSYTLVATTFSSGTIGDLSVFVDHYVERPVTIGAISMGETRELVVDNTDGEVMNGSRGEILTFEGEAGTQVTYSVMSASSTPSVRLVAPTFESLGDIYTYSAGVPSQLTSTLPVSGTYRLVAGSGSSEPTTIVVSLAEGSVAIQPTGTALTSGRTTAGVLEEGDSPDSDGTGVFDAYLMEVAAGKVLNVTTESDSLDGYLRVYDSYGTLVAENDDSNGTLNPSASIVATSDTTYRIEYSDLYMSYGGYSITATIMDAPEFSPVTVRTGQTYEGAISNMDSVRADGGRQDVYYFEGDQGDEMTFSLTSTAGATLTVISPTGETLSYGYGTEYDQSVYSGMNSFAGRLPADGRYILNVSGYLYGEDLAYELRVASGIATVSGEPLTIGNELAGVLTPSEINAMYSTPTDRYVFEVVEGGLYEFAVTTPSSDMTISVTNSSSSTYLSGYSTGLGPVTAAGFLAPGAYSLDLYSYSVYTDVPYTITTRQLPVVPVNPLALSVGTSFSGTLDSNSPRNSAGLMAAFLSIEAGQVGSLDLFLNSTDPNASVTVFDDLGNYVTSGYGYGGSTSPATTITPSPSRQYMVVLTSSVAGTTWSCNLR